MIWAILFLVLSYLLVTSLFGFALAFINLGFLGAFAVLGTIYLSWNFNFWTSMLIIFSFIALIYFLDKNMNK